MPLGFGVSSGSSSSSSQSSGSSFVSQQQQPFLDFLRNAGQTQFGQQQGGLQGLFGQSQGLFDQGQQFGQQGVNNQFLDALGQQAGGNPELVAAQTAQLGTDIGLFTDQLQAGNRRDAVGGNALGGGRQGVAEGITNQGALQSFQQGALGFQLADQQRSLQAAQAGGGLLGQGAAQGGANLNNLFGLLQAPFQSQFDALGSLGQAIGPTDILSQQQGSSSSRASNRSFNVTGL